MFNFLLKKNSKYNEKYGISSSDYRKLSSYPSGHYENLSVKFKGKDILFSNPFWFLHSLEEIFVDEVYLFNKSDEDVLILDCGANIGLSSIYFKSIFKNAKIIAFEPDQKIFGQLQKNINTFGIENDVQLINAAAWINEDDLTFFSEGSLGGKILNENNNHPNNTIVKSIRLRNYIENKKIFFLKIDIEGAEYTVLNDIKNHLNNIENLFIEFHNTIDEENTLSEILSWIDKAGFKYYIKEAWNNLPRPFTQENHGGGFHMQLNIFCFRTHD
ncbi:FkbM family methyltransferase [Chryseobacterium sp. MEBOG07]|uniref:FkbM family methyltransferase n=1 Tax=Chryseobacterium sp. MEBOG07 TaxID=2879939 RepID=UPI001F007C90|nr:FkbM family methyltransferase [Chryseobacterium sp. MEBOG07]UKB79316.1 FkbM family methyltransferase [Chryseobacterium sp. MEBOG07]